MPPLDFPFDEVVAKANEIVARGGARVHQKFTCAKCGSRQTMETPNTFHETGRCEECGHVTNIRKRGCNYVLMMGQVPPTKAEAN